MLFTINNVYGIYDTATAYKELNIHLIIMYFRHVLLYLTDLFFRQTGDVHNCFQIRTSPQGFLCKSSDIPGFFHLFLSIVYFIHIFSFSLMIALYTKFSINTIKIFHPHSNVRCRFSLKNP